MQIYPAVIVKKWQYTLATQRKIIYNFWPHLCGTNEIIIE